MEIAVKQQPLRELIAAGLAHHQKGDLVAAEQSYQRVLAREPAHADALHLLGVLRGRTDPQTGAQLVEQAILANPRVSAYHNNLGTLLLRAADLEGAERSYRRALRVDAGNADACLNLGNLLSTAGRDAEARECLQTALQLAPGMLEASMSMGRLEERKGNWAAAGDCFRRVTQAAPRYAPALLMLGGVSKALGQWAEAEEHLRRALALDPGYADAYCNLGNLLRERDRLMEAADCYRHAIELCPSKGADACNNLGVTLSGLGCHEEALAALLRAVEIRPDYVEAHFNLAKEAILLDRDPDSNDSNNVGFELLAKVLALDPAHAGAYLELGNLQQACDLLPEAVESYRCALARNVLNPADAWSNLGAALAELARFDEGEAAYAKSFALKPDSSSAWCNRGVLAEKRGLFEEAAAAYRRAAELNPSSFEARMNLASMLAQMGEEEGLALLDGLVREQPLSAHVQWTRGFNLLLHGRYLEGWPGLEWRDRVKALRLVPRSFAVPRWQGESLKGRTILLYAEQGFGDTLQFVRYVPLVAALGARVVLEVQPELRRLLENVPGVAACVSLGQEELPKFDVQAPLMSLPYLLGTTLETIPPPVEPGVVEPGSTEPAHPREQRLASQRGPLRVGLVWAGNPKHKRDHVRTIALNRWRSLAMVQGASFVSLQIGPAELEIEEHGACFGFLDRPPIRDFKDTAEVLAGLDLVITVDSAVAHLAGTMHTPVWILLDNTRDWRWGLAGSRTPWYPSARLFRQTKAADWSGPIEEVARALAAECSHQLARTTQETPGGLQMSPLDPVA